jgi:hypothetical protein
MDDSTAHSRGNFSAWQIGEQKGLIALQSGRYEKQIGAGRTGWVGRSRLKSLACILLIQLAGEKGGQE